MNAARERPYAAPQVEPFDNLAQLQSVVGRMTAMLSTVVFTWEKSGARVVPAEA